MPITRPTILVLLVVRLLAMMLGWYPSSWAALRTFLRSARLMLAPSVKARDTVA